MQHVSQQGGRQQQRITSASQHKRRLVCMQGRQGRRHRSSSHWLKCRHQLAPWALALFPSKRGPMLTLGRTTLRP